MRRRVRFFLTGEERKSAVELQIRIERTFSVAVPKGKQQARPSMTAEPEKATSENQMRFLQVIEDNSSPSVEHRADNPDFFVSPFEAR